jgi:tRNA(His) 5'-end guanylyltransferase
VSAGIASSVFTHAMDAPAHFDSRLWVGVSEKQVVDYFRWRQADSVRCCLNGWCYWTLRKEGKTVKEATAALEGKGFSNKNELLFQHSINFNDLPAWQKRGTGLYWEEFTKEGKNPVTGKTVTAKRRRIRIDEELPMGEVYDDFIRNFLENQRK